MSSNQVLLTGYVRGIQNDDNDYMDIISIIMQYHKQPFAKFFGHDGDKQNMRFGDIFAESWDIFALDINGNSQKVGNYDLDCNQEYSIDIEIPLSITEHLSNAVSFYSTIDQHKEFQERDYSYVVINIKHDDQWIIEQFGGPLLPQYTMRYVDYHRYGNREYSGLEVEYGTFKRLFKTPDNINYINMIKFICDPTRTRG